MKATLMCGCSGDRMLNMYTFCPFHLFWMRSVTPKEADQLFRMLIERIDRLSG